MVSSAQICLRDMVDKIPTCYNILLLNTGLLLLSGDKWRKSYRVAGVNVAQEMGNQMNGLHCLSISLYFYICPFLATTLVTSEKKFQVLLHERPQVINTATCQFLINVEIP